VFLQQRSWAYRHQNATNKCLQVCDRLDRDTGSIQGSDDEDEADEQRFDSEAIGGASKAMNEGGNDGGDENDDDLGGGRGDSDEGLGSSNEEAGTVLEILTMTKEGETRKRTTGMARGQRGRRRLSKSVRFHSF